MLVSYGPIPNMGANIFVEAYWGHIREGDIAPICPLPHMGPIWGCPYRPNMALPYIGPIFVEIWELYWRRVRARKSERTCDARARGTRKQVHTRTACTPPTAHAHTRKGGGTRRSETYEQSSRGESLERRVCRAGEEMEW